MFKHYIDSVKDQIINKTCELIRIPSVNSEALDGKPFGKQCDNALTYMLNLGNELGFRTKNLDGYCGYIEFGEGKELVGIIAHLDVVPADNGWTKPPYSAIIENNNIYGRGAIDDKGPVIASLYAMKAVKDNYNINKRVRLILGLNEENDWKCIEHYKSCEEHPNIGFSPDSDFPCIYAEKAILSVYLKEEYKYSNNNIIIESIDCLNNPINVVPKLATCVLKVNNMIDINNLITKLKNIVGYYGYEIDIFKIDNNSINLTSHGVSAHSAHPDLGVNALSRLLIVLYYILKQYNIRLNILDFFYKYINTEFNGKSLGINYKDQSRRFNTKLSKSFY